VIVLVHTAHPQAVEHAGPGFGRLLSPRNWSRAADTAAAGIPWAADNEAYVGFDEDGYRRMIHGLPGIPGCLFVVAPDIVADWEHTRYRFAKWLPELRGLPLAYVAQDDQPPGRVPWDAIVCLFVGGTTAYKLSSEAEQLVREAKRRGLWVHMGRVNSRRRFHYARAIGCDSVDGSQFSRWRDRWVPHGLAWAGEHLQERLPT
jgi:hypothetical protein